MSDTGKKGATEEGKTNDEVKKNTENPVEEVASNTIVISDDDESDEGAKQVGFGGPARGGGQRGRARGESSEGRGRGGASYTALRMRASNHPDVLAQKKK